MITPNSKANIQGVSTVEKKFGVSSKDLPMQVLLCGFQMSAGSNRDYTTPIKITTEAEAILKFGQGSEIHKMVQAAFEGNSESLPVHCLALEDAAGNKRRIATLTVQGNAASDGIITLHLSGMSMDTIQVVVSNEDTANEIAAKIQKACDEKPNIPYTTAVANAVVTFTSKNSGNVRASTLSVNAFEHEREQSPQNVNTAIATTQEADAVASVTKIVDALKINTIWFTDIVIHSDIQAHVEEVATLSGNPNQKTGLYSDDDYRPFNLHVATLDENKANLIAYVQKRLSAIVLYAAPKYVESVVQLASYLAGRIALLATKNVSRSYHREALPILQGSSKPAVDFTRVYQTRNELYAQGITPLQDDAGRVILGDVVTTWEPADKNTNSPLKLLVNQRKAWSMAYDVKRIDNDPENTGRPIVQSVGATRQSIRAIDTDVIKSIVAQLVGQWLERGLIFDDDYTLKNMKVEIDQNNSDRINKYIPLILSGNIRIGDTELQISREVSFSLAA